MKRAKSGRVHPQKPDLVEGEEGHQEGSATDLFTAEEETQTDQMNTVQANFAQGQSYPNYYTESPGGSSANNKGENSSLDQGNWSPQPKEGHSDVTIDMGDAGRFSVLKKGKIYENITNIFRRKDSNDYITWNQKPVGGDESETECIKIEPSNNRWSGRSNFNGFESNSGRNTETHDVNFMGKAGNMSLRSVMKKKGNTGQLSSIGENETLKQSNSSNITTMRHLNKEDLGNLGDNSKKIAKFAKYKKSLSSLRRMFSDSTDNYDEASISYSEFLRILSKQYGQETIRASFNLTQEIKETDETSIITVLVVIFWVRIHCMLVDQFGADQYLNNSPDDARAQLVPPRRDVLLEIKKIFREVFDGNTCLSRFNRTCCNCICIECAKILYKAFFLHCYMRSRLLRQIYSAWPNCASTCCIWLHYFLIIVLIVFAFVVSNTSGSLNIMKKVKDHMALRQTNVKEMPTNITQI